MDDTAAATRAPIHLWIVGIVATLWNAFGCYDYFMTRTQGAQYIKTMMPGIDADAMMSYVNGFPIWASVGWGLGVWCGLAGSILLLMRSRWAETLLALSAIGAILGLGYQILHPADIPAMHEGFNAIVPYVIIVIAVLLYAYARRMRAKGVLA